MKLIATILFMTSATILSAVEDYLRPLMVENKGALAVAETEEDAVEMLASAPDRWRVVLSMDGDKPLDADLNPAGLVVGSLVAWVQASKGMEAQPRKSIARDQVNGTPAFFTRLHWLIRKIRGLQLNAIDIDRTGFRYQGWQWLKFEGQPLFRTARASFDLIFAHDDPATDPDGHEPVVLPAPFKIVGAGDDYYVISVNGVAHGRIPRFASEAGDPTGTATGYAIAATGEDYYVVTLDGTPHGRLPRFAA